MECESEVVAVNDVDDLCALPVELLKRRVVRLPPRSCRAPLGVSCAQELRVEGWGDCWMRVEGDCWMRVEGDGWLRVESDGWLRIKGDGCLKV